MEKSKEGAATQIIRSQGVLSRQTENGAFLFNTFTNELFRVNEIGGRIWELLGENHSVEEIAHMIHSEFEGAEMERVRSSLGVFLAKLSERKLLTKKSSSAE